MARVMPPSAGVSRPFQVPGSSLTASQLGGAPPPRLTLPTGPVHGASRPVAAAAGSERISPLQRRSMGPNNAGAYQPGEEGPPQTPRDDVQRMYPGEDVGGAGARLYPQQQRWGGGPSPASNSAAASAASSSQPDSVMAQRWQSEAAPMGGGLVSPRGATSSSMGRVGPTASANGATAVAPAGGAGGDPRRLVSASQAPSGGGAGSMSMAEGPWGRGAGDPAPSPKQAASMWETAPRQPGGEASAFLLPQRPSAGNSVTAQSGAPTSSEPNHGAGRMMLRGQPGVRPTGSGQGASHFGAFAGGESASFAATKRRELEAMQKNEHLRKQKERLQMEIQETSEMVQESFAHIEDQKQRRNELTQEHQRLLEERELMEHQLQEQGASGEMQVRVARLEREIKEMAQQFREFEQERLEYSNPDREHVRELQASLTAKEQSYGQQLTELQLEHESTKEAVKEEKEGLEARIQQLVRERDALNVEWARASARAEQAGGGSNSARAMQQPRVAEEATLRTILRERESLMEKAMTQGSMIESFKSRQEVTSRRLAELDAANHALKLQKAQLEARRRGR